MFSTETGNNFGLRHCVTCFLGDILLGHIYGTVLGLNFKQLGHVRKLQWENTNY